MDFAWIEYLKLAEMLSRNPDEASLRSAISRAYYFIYHRANDRALSRNYRRPDEGGIHNSLWSFYERNTDADCRRVALLGKRLHERRVKADYRRDSYARINEEVVQVLIDAKRCAEMIEALRSDLPKDPPPRVYSI